MDGYFYQGEIKEKFYDKIFSYHPLLKTHSNQEHYNSNLYSPNNESIEQLVEQIIRSLPVWRLSNWEYVLYVYFEFLEEIMDYHPLLIFFWYIPCPMCDPIYIICCVIILFYCPWLVPVSEISSHYRCCYLIFTRWVSSMSQPNRSKLNQRIVYSS